jgi:DNA-binding CsgD family transcriptional regulator
MDKVKVNSILTLRKIEILELLSQGFTDQEISDRLHISINTVKTHLKQIYKTLEVKNRLQASTIYNQLKNTL